MADKTERARQTGLGDDLPGSGMTGGGAEETVGNAPEERHRASHPALTDENLDATRETLAIWGDEYPQLGGLLKTWDVLVAGLDAVTKERDELRRVYAQAERECGEAWTEYNDSENARLALEGELRKAQQRNDELEAALWRLVNLFDSAPPTGLVPGTVDAAYTHARKTLAAQTDRDEWKLTYERIDFAPIWSRAEFEARARAEGWLVGDALPQPLEDAASGGQA